VPDLRSVHAKDGKWPTDPSKLGEEVLIGQGLVDFQKVFTTLHEFGYPSDMTIKHDISGPQQIEHVKNERLYLQRILDEVLS
jgi:L-ribulose-5-phosphate 3-epimerase